jgi:hypothetical protein
MVISFKIGECKMLIGIQGGLGSGKSIMLIRYLLMDFMSGFNIMCNMKDIKDIKYEFLDMEKLLQYDESNSELQNVTVGIDEITVLCADCRRSSSNANLIFSYLVLQSRKRNCNVYYTTQSMSMIDLRVVEHTHLIVNCEKVYDEFNQEIPDVAKYEVVDLRNPDKPQLDEFYMNLKPYYKYYNTDEVITPLGMTDFKNIKKKEVKKK